MPEFTPTEHANEVCDELIESIRQLKKPAKSKLLRRMAKALQVLNTPPNSEGGKQVSEGEKQSSEGETPIQRVNAPTITTSTNPTAPNTIRLQPRTHLRQTRNNTPGSVPPITNQDTVPKSRRSARLNPNIVEDDNIRPTQPNSYRLPFTSPNIISQEAVNFLTEQVYYNEDPHTWTPSEFVSSSPTKVESSLDVDIEHFCAGVVHPITGETISSYRKLIMDPITRDVWETGFGKEFGNLAQGDERTGEKGTNSIFVLTHEEIKNIPKDRTVTYGRIVVDYRPQKEDPNRVRITAGGNLIKYPGELTTRTADLTTSKILWNSVLSTEDAKFMGIDIKSFYLTAPLDRYEYMKMPIDVFPEHTKKQYNLDQHVKNGYVYLEIRRSVYGLPQAGVLANKLLRKRLAPEGYFEVAHTPGLWRHVTRPISFTLVVDDFGVKYVGKEHADHLISVLKKHYKIAEDWEGNLYCGIQLDWNYEERYLDISMPNYIKKVLQRFKHEKPTKPQHCPYKSQPRKFGTDAQDPIPETQQKP